MQSLKRSAPLLPRAAALLRRAAGSAPSTAGMQYPPPGVGACVSVAKFASSGQQSMPQHKANDAFVTMEDHKKALQELTKGHEKALADLNRTMEETLLEQKNKFEAAMIMFAHERKREAFVKSMKTCVEHVNIINEFKLLEEEFRRHKLETEAKMSEDQLSRLQTIGVSFAGLCTLVVVVSVFLEFFPK